MGPLREALDLEAIDSSSSRGVDWRKAQLSAARDVLKLRHAERAREFAAEAAVTPSDIDPETLAQACPDGFGRFWKELDLVARGRDPESALSAGQPAG